jgi:hypothetical protein
MPAPGSHQTPRLLPVPPDIPGAAVIDPVLAGYLRTFALWCRQSFSDKLPRSQALPGILLQANDAPAGTTPKVFQLQVTTAGTVVAVPVATGSATRMVF